MIISTAPIITTPKSSSSPAIVTSHIITTNATSCTMLKCAQIPTPFPICTNLMECRLFQCAQIQHVQVDGMSIIPMVHINETNASHPQFGVLDGVLDAPTLHLEEMLVEVTEVPAYHEAGPSKLSQTFAAPTIDTILFIYPHIHYPHIRIERPFSWHSSHFIALSLINKLNLIQHHNLIDVHKLQHLVTLKMISFLLYLLILSFILYLFNHNKINHTKYHLVTIVKGTSTAKYNTFIGGVGTRYHTATPLFIFECRQTDDNFDKIAGEAHGGFLHTLILCLPANRDASVTALISSVNEFTFGETRRAPTTSAPALITASILSVNEFIFRETRRTPTTSTPASITASILSVNKFIFEEEGDLLSTPAPTPTLTFLKTDCLSLSSLPSIIFIFFRFYLNYFIVCFSI